MEEFAASKLANLIAELDRPLDDEHQSVSVSHESGWTIAGYGDGHVIWEDVEDEDGPPPRHMGGVSRAELAELMRLVAGGDFDQIERLGWLPGYGS